MVEILIKIIDLQLLFLSVYIIMISNENVIYLLTYLQIYYKSFKQNTIVYDNSNLIFNYDIQSIYFTASFSLQILSKIALQTIVELKLIALLRLIFIIQQQRLLFFLIICF